MKQIIKNLQKDKPLLFGLTLVFISALLYGFSFPSYQNFRDTFTPLFFIHYGLAIVYVFYLIVRKELRLLELFRGKSFPYHLLLLMLFNISAYSLNQTLPVFHESVNWLSVFLIAENSLLLAYILLPSINKGGASFLLFAFTLAFFFNVYQSLMIFPYMAIGLMASPFLGISLHVLVPLAFVLALAMILVNLAKKGADWKALALACSCCFLFQGYYILQWKKVNTAISQITHQQHIPGSVNELPEWVRLAQSLPDHTVAEKALQSGLIYQEYSQWNNWFGQNLRFEETKFHDPLLTIASFAGGKIDLDRETKIKILDAKYNMRHESADRFWSGLNLKTSDVITNVQLFPAYRLAYTEMILRIRNESFDRQSSWFSQEEALYTFQLPEGGTVSSLSLWIEGMEAKARLTTKEKAEKAYNTIVGREARDPSAVYWMEGNKIRVRVFPCTPKEDRQFKIGITSPLSFQNGQLTYSNISFKGPNFNKAHASVNVLTQGTKEALESTLKLKKSDNTYSWEGDYQYNWRISTRALPLADRPFYFNGNAYTVENLPQTFIPFQAEEVYLDLHQGWKQDDVKDLTALFPERNFLVYNYRTGRMEHLSKKEVLLFVEEEILPQFSLFPFHKIKSPEHSLLITKGNRATPNLSDLKETTFSEELFGRLGQSIPVKVFDLNPAPSDYIRSLNEFKVLHYAHGSISELQEYLKKRQFPVVPGQENAVAILPAGISITRSTAIAGETGTAPDHLLRLFSYNQVLKNIGQNYFNKDYLQEETIKEAALGNVVSPISSLIVLETLEDYERFEIDENKNSLGNASINASGAVPEPHEWALIIIGVLFLSWMLIFKGRSPFNL